MLLTLLCLGVVCAALLVRVLFVAGVIQTRLTALEARPVTDLAETEHRLGLVLAMVRNLYDVDLTPPDPASGMAIRRGVGRALIRARLAARKAKK